MLKELRETGICLKIIIRKPVMKNLVLAEKAFAESNELAAIFNKSIDTASKKKESK